MKISTRMWIVTTALLGAALVASTIYIVVLRHRVERATAFAFGGMMSVRSVCGQTAAAIREAKDPEALWLVAEACTAMPDRNDGRSYEISHDDWDALARRIDRETQEGLLPLYGAGVPGIVDERFLPKGMRD
jgi:hypothetical protein